LADPVKLDEGLESENHRDKKAAIPDKSQEFKQVIFGSIYLPKLQFIKNII